MKYIVSAFALFLSYYVATTIFYPILSDVFGFKKATTTLSASTKTIVEAAVEDDIIKIEKKQQLAIEKTNVKLEPAPMPVEPVKPTIEIAPIEIKSKFKTIEEITANWEKIPVSAFPREFVTNQDITLTMMIGGGSAKKIFKKGSTLYALNQEANTGNIVVGTSKNEKEAIKATVKIDDINFKEVLIDVYNKWKINEESRVQHQEEMKDQQQARSKEQQKNPAAAKGLGSKPTRDSSGVYPLLISSMKSGKVTDITPEKVISWGEPLQLDGMWVINVMFTTQTLLGKMDVEAQAQIKGDVVMKWIYTGSGEEVP
jgi:hypothetical protein